MVERACESVGIDLGTTYSSLAYMDAQMTPRMVSDTSGHTVIPSVIYFDDAGVIVGDLALQQSKVSADRVVQFIKVHMGDHWQQTIQGRVHTAESLSGIIVSNLVREAEPQIGPIHSAVITVPAYFTEKRRRATEQAGEIAGLDVIGTLNEPMAATLAYGIHREDKEQIVLVYDLGGGTFDVTIVRISPTEIEELATNGNRQLGGRDWDQFLVDFVADDFAKAYGIDPRTDPQAVQNIRLECELAKRRLSRMAKAPIPFHVCGHDHTTEVTREQFESMTASLLQSTRLTTELALEDAGLQWEQVARVVLVGGSTHMPAVRKMLKDVSGVAPDIGVNPVVAVALGAAIYAHMLETGGGVRAVHRHPEIEPEEEIQPAPRPESAPPVAQAPTPPPIRAFGGTDAAARTEPWLEPTEAGDAEITTEQPRQESERPPGDYPVTQRPPSFPTVRFVTAHGVGVKVRGWEGWKNSVLIPKNTPVPCGKTKQYVTASGTGGGTRIKVEITQGDTPDISLAEVLGTGRIEGFPGNEPPGQPVDVVMQFDEQGRLHVEAIYVNTGQQMQMSLEIPGGLRPEQVEQYREDLSNTNFLTVFRPEEALQGLEADDDDDDEDDEGLFDSTRRFL